MIHHLVLAAFGTALSFAATANAQAAATRDKTGPYLAAGYGAAFGNREIDDSNHTSDERTGRGLKLFGGVQVTEHFGIQAGYVRMRGLNQDTGAGASLVTRSANGHSLYAAGTARLPLGHSFALTSKVGISFGRVVSVSPSTADSDTLLGSKTSLLIGTGAEYVFDDRLAFTVELESYGKISNHLKGNTLTFGSRIMF